jgi:hypothetical protein
VADTAQKHGLTRITDAKLAQARGLARLLDRAFKVPGTKITFGVDALLGLIPGGGDIAGAVFSSWLILLGARMGLPRHILMQMITNVAIDTIGGSVPVIGDLFDVYWKSNSRNLAILERFANSELESKRVVSRPVVYGALAVVALLILAGVWLAVVLVRALIHLVR